MLGFIKNITELFVGENSKKRQIGLGFASIMYSAFLMGFIDYATMTSLIPLLALFMGVAYSSKLTKVGDALNELKAKKAKKRKR
jgi:hypothetical protein